MSAAQGTDIERRFHEIWLGMAQPIEGLVVSIPALLEAQCFARHPPAEQAKLIDWQTPPQTVTFGLIA